MATDGIVDESAVLQAFDGSPGIQIVVRASDLRIVAANRGARELLQREPPGRRPAPGPARPRDPDRRDRPVRGRPDRRAVPRGHGPGGRRLVRPGVRPVGRPGGHPVARRVRRAGRARSPPASTSPRACAPRASSARARPRPTSASPVPARSCCACRGRCSRRPSRCSPASTSRRPTSSRVSSRRPAGTGSTRRPCPTGACADRR